MVKKYHYFLLILVLVLAFVLRFYKLGAIPDGLQQDETSLGYNSYSILKTLKDEHGALLPQNFKAFGEYKLPGYIYASVLPIYFFGFNAFSIRFISALSGFFSIIIVYFITKELIVYLKNDKINNLALTLPLITAFLLAINPWHLHFSRAAFEVMLANFLILSAVLSFLIGIKKNNLFIYIMSIILFSFSIYTYNIARVFTPLLMLTLVATFNHQLKNIPKKKLVLLTIIFILLMLPFLSNIFARGGADSTSGTLIFSSAKVQSHLLEFRSYFVDLPPIISKILFNYWTLCLWQYLNNLFSHLSVNFYFIDGGDHGNNSIGTTGQWYLFELPLIVYGIIYLWKNRAQKTPKLLLAWIIGLVAVSGVTREPPQATRTFLFIYPISFSSAMGLFLIGKSILKTKKVVIKYSICALAFIMSFYLITIYFVSYYIRFPIYYAKHWRTADRDLSIYLKENNNLFEKVIIDRKSNLKYSSLLTYINYQPKDFQNEARWSNDDSEGFSYPLSFGKYEFRDINWSEDIKLTKALLVANYEEVPSGYNVYHAFNYPERPVVINVGQDLFNFRTQDPGYAIVKSKGQ